MLPLPPTIEMVEWNIVLTCGMRMVFKLLTKLHTTNCLYKAKMVSCLSGPGYGPPPIHSVQMYPSSKFGQNFPEYRDIYASLVSDCL